MKTQVQKIYDIMVENYNNGGKGLNSVYIRNTYYIVDVATRMFDNKANFAKIGLKFDTRTEKDRTATYFLKPIDESVLPTYLKASKVTTEPQKMTWKEIIKPDGERVFREVPVNQASEQLSF